MTAKFEPSQCPDPPSFHPRLPGPKMTRSWLRPTAASTSPGQRRRSRAADTDRRECGRRFSSTPPDAGAATGYALNVANGLIPSDWTIVVETLDRRERKVLVKGGSHPRYLTSGHIVFARSGSLLAVPFDITRLEVTGSPAVVVEDVMHAEGGENNDLNSGVAQFSVANNGSLAYVPAALPGIRCSPSLG